MLLLIFGTPHKQKIKKQMMRKSKKQIKKILEENKKDISVRRVY
jgi:hypothetical protein